MTQPPTRPINPSPRSNKLAVASLVCGCIALPGLVIPFLIWACYMPLAIFTGIAAILCGMLGLRRTNRKNQNTLAITGIIFGTLVLLEYIAYGFLAILIFFVRTHYTPPPTKPLSTTPATATAPLIPEAEPTSPNAE